MKWLKGLYPQMSSEHVSVGQFSDGSSAVYFNFRVWCFAFVFSYLMGLGQKPVKRIRHQKFLINVRNKLLFLDLTSTKLSQGDILFKIFLLISICVSGVCRRHLVGLTMAQLLPLTSPPSETLKLLWYSCVNIPVYNLVANKYREKMSFSTWKDIWCHTVSWELLLLLGGKYQHKCLIWFSVFQHFLSEQREHWKSCWALSGKAESTTLS